jgi:hypothetical protein
MHSYIAVIFKDTWKPYRGMYALWQLDAAGDITVHGTTVVHLDACGDFQVDTMETQPAMATAVGVGIDAFLGALAGPGAAGGAAIGAAGVGAVSIGADLMRADARSQATSETAFVLNPGESAVIADVSEDSALAIDSRMRELGGIVRRRAWSTLPI